MQETVLLYELEEQREKQLGKVLRRLGCCVKRVERKDYLKPVGTLAGAEVFVTVDKEYDGPPFGGPMLVMAGMNSGKVDEILAALRECDGGSISCKAVLTPTNQFWTSLMLYEELQKEHEFLNRNRNN